MVKDSLQTLLARLFTIIGRFAYSIIINRALGPLGKGYFEVIQVVPGILQNFGLFGFDHANVYFSGRQPKKIPILIANSIVLGITLGIASAILGALYYMLFEGKYTDLYHEFGRFIVWVPLVVTPLHLIATYFDMLVYGTNRIWVRNVKEVVAVILRLVFPILFVIVLKMWVKGAVWAFIFIFVGLFIYSWYFLVAIFGRRIGRFDWNTVKESFAFGKFEFGSNFATYLFYKVDILLLFLLLPATDIVFMGVGYKKEVLIGLYSLGVYAITLLWTIPDAITTALKPKITMKGEEERKKLVPPSLRMCMISVVAASIFAGLLVKPAIGIVYGPEWIPAAIPFYWLIPGILTLSLAKIFATDLFSRGKPYYATWISIISLALNLILNFILIPRPGYYGGMVGSAIASSCSYSFSFILFCYIYTKESGERIRDVFVPRWSDFIEIWQKILILLKLREESDQDI